MTYFVTGATGFIGSHLVSQLIRRGHRVNALVRDTRKAEAIKTMGASVFIGDITEKESMRKPMEGTDGVFHVAGLYKLGIRDRKMAEAINVEGTRNVLELSKELAIKKCVYTSTLAVYSDTRGETVDESYRFTGRHIAVYDKTKWQAHFEVAIPMIENGLPLVIVLPGAVYGPGDTSAIGDALKEFIKGELKIVPKGTVFCWSYIEDIVHGHILAMEKGKPGESYIIAGPPARVEDAFVLIEKISGIKGPKKRSNPRMLRLMSMFMKVIELFVKPSAAFSSEGLRVMAGVTYLASNRKAKEELGYSPRSLEEGMRETVEHLMREQG
jgi:nucleoside-diphosphate-sugar epimerase